MTIELHAHDPGSLHAQMAYAEALSHASLLPDAYRGQPANVLLALAMGDALGLPAAEAINSINVIKGRPTMSADLIAALIRRAGHRMRIREEATPGGPRVTVQIIRTDDPDFTFEVVWDRAKARQAGLTGDNWRRYEGQMMRARAITECARQACSDVLHGVIYDPSELQDSDTPAAPSVRQVDRPAPAIAPTTSLDWLIESDQEPQPDHWPERIDGCATADEAAALWHEARARQAPEEVIEAIAQRGHELRRAEAVATATDVLDAEVLPAEPEGESA